MFAYNVARHHVVIVPHLICIRLPHTSVSLSLSLSVPLSKQDLEEVGGLLSDFGIFSEVAIREHFRTTDVNEDGSVSFDEFVRRVSRSYACLKRCITLNEVIVLPFVYLSTSQHGHPDTLHIPSLTGGTRSYLPPH